jgi:hypothetical protein
MQSKTRWCLNEGLDVIWRINLRLFPIGRVNLQGLSGITTPNVKNRTLAQLSQLRAFSGFFALIFVVKPCVLIVAL